MARTCAQVRRNSQAAWISTGYVVLSPLLKQLLHFLKQLGALSELSAGFYAFFEKYWLQNQTQYSSISLTNA